MVEAFDHLYARSKEGMTFTNLMEVISSEENIKLAYRNIKRNTGSWTPGVDGMTIEDLEKVPVDQFIAKVHNQLAWYNSKPVKRVDIPKPNRPTRPLEYLPCGIG